MGGLGQGLDLTERPGRIGLKYLLCARPGATAFSFHIVFPPFDEEGDVPIFKKVN